MDLQPPKTTTNCRNFVDMIQYYRDMWKRHYHILAPITEASSGKRVKQIRWTKYIEKSFLDIKRIVLEKTLLNCPDLTIHLTIHIDVPDKQLSAVISQNNKPIASYSKTFKNTIELYNNIEGNSIDCQIYQTVPSNPVWIQNRHHSCVRE